MKHESHGHGLWYAIIGAFCFSAMGGILYACREHADSLSVSATMVSRVLFNFLLAFLPIQALKAGAPTKFRSEIHPTKPLVAWSICGGLTLAAYNAAITTIGMGQASFWQSSQTIFIALLAPLIAFQSVGRSAWIAILGSFFGFLLFHGGAVATHASLYGQSLAVFSGFTSALAYLLLARIGGKSSPRAITIYWCFGASCVAFAMLFFEQARWEWNPVLWIYLCAAGIIASIGNIALTIAYQRAPAALVATITFVTPVLSTVMDAILFRIFPTRTMWLGSLLILGFGVILPLRQLRRNRTRAHFLTRSLFPSKLYQCSFRDPKNRSSSSG